MKSKFLLSLATLLSTTGAWAATNYTVGTASEFAEAWGKLAEGDTITLTADVSLSGVNLTPATVSGVTITSATGAQHTLLAAPPLGDVALSQVSLVNSRSAVESLISVEGDTQFGPGVEVSSTAGGAVVVNDGASLSVGAGSSFRNNTAAAEGPAVYVEDQQSSGKVNLLVQSAEGADTTFEGNTADAGGYANDVYLGKNATMQVEAAAGSSVSLKGGVMSDSSGTAAVTVSGEGKVVLGDGSYYTGSLTLQGGETTMAGTTWGSGEGTVEVQQGATLSLTEGAQLNASLSSAGTLSVGSATLGADATLSGQVEFSGEALVVMGSLQLEDVLTFSFEGYKAGEYLLIDNYSSFTGGVEHITLSGSDRFAYELGLRGSDVYLTVSSLGNDLNWLGGKKATWGVDSATLWGSEDGSVAYEDGDHVHFTTGGTVSIVGPVAPVSITVTAAKAVTFKTTYNKKTGTYSGSIEGESTSVVMDGGAKGKLTMNNGNSYGGGTYLHSGTLAATGESSFGTGDVYVHGGTLDLASKSVANIIFLEGAAVIKNGKKFLGSLGMAADLLKGSQLNIVAGQSATIFSGTVNGTISGAGEVLVTYRPETGYPAPQLGTTGKITTNALRLMDESVLLVSNKGLLMNTKASVITIQDAELNSAGKVSAYALRMWDGLLDVRNAKPMVVTLNGDFTAESGAQVNLYGSLTANQLLLEGSYFTLAMDEADITAKTAPKAQSITLKGKNVTNYITNSVLDAAGKMSVTGNLTITDAYLTLHDVASAAKPKAQGLSVKGDLTVEGKPADYAYAVELTGALSAASLTAVDTVISVADVDGLASQSVKLTRKESSKGVFQLNTLNNSTLAVNGSMSVAGSLEVQDSTLMVKDRSGKAKKMSLSIGGSLTVGGEADPSRLGYGSIVSVDGNVDIKGKNTLFTLENSFMSVGGNLTVAGDMLLSESADLDAAPTKPNKLTVKGSLQMYGTEEDVAELSTSGSASIAALTAVDAKIISGASYGNSSTQSFKLTRKESSKGVSQMNKLERSTAFINANVSVAGSLSLYDSMLAVCDATNHGKTRGLSVSGDLLIGGAKGSSVYVSGALSAKNLTLETGSSLTLAANKFSTVKVNGALTLNRLTDDSIVMLDFGFSVTDKDVAKGKQYTLFTFKSYAGEMDNVTLNSLIDLGYTGVYTLAFNDKKNGIVLTVADAAEWNAYAESVRESAPSPLDAANADTAVATVAEPEEEEPEAADMLLDAAPAADAAVDALMGKVADTLVQSTWGAVHASRAFVDSIYCRGTYAVELAEDKSVAWLNLMGNTSSISSDGAHAGADFTLTGAVFGVENRLTELSTIGFALGNSHGKVSTESAYSVDQNSLHLGIYGSHCVHTWGTDTLTLSWTAAYSRTISEADMMGMPCEWTQESTMLDARLTWLHELDYRTNMKVFAGLEYMSTGSADYNGLTAGSYSNLRLELGVGVVRELDPHTSLFGEISMVADMLRDDPSAFIGSFTVEGAAPGRCGVSLSIGVTHKLTDEWFINGAYNLDMMENASSHSLNIGACYKF